MIILTYSQNAVLHQMKFPTLSVCTQNVFPPLRVLVCEDMASKRVINFRPPKGSYFSFFKRIFAIKQFCSRSQVGDHFKFFQ